MRPLTARLAVCALVLAAAAGAAPAQVLTVTPQSYDFGTMKQQETRTTQVELRNDGGGLLVIEDVHADCGCTVPTLTVRELRPGESTTLDITFDSKKFSGTVYKSVRITSNDPTNPVTDVMLVANVTTPLIVDPVSQRVGFQRCPQGEVHTKRVTFTATEAPRLEITADATRRGLFDVAVVNDLDGDPQRAALDITLPADMPTGKQRDNVRVRTNLPDMETVDIEVRCWVHEALMASPGALNFRFKPEFKASVRVAPAKDGVQFKVTSAEVDLPQIDVKVIETVPNKETLVVLEGTPVSKEDVRARTNRGRIKGTLKIHTDLEQQPVIEIPVTYMVRM